MNNHKVRSIDMVCIKRGIYLDTIILLATLFLFTSVWIYISTMHGPSHGYLYCGCVMVRDTYQHTYLQCCAAVRRVPLLDSEASVFDSQPRLQMGPVDSVTV